MNYPSTMLLVLFEQPSPPRVYDIPPVISMRPTLRERAARTFARLRRSPSGARQCAEAHA